MEMSDLIHAAPACSVPDRAIVQKAILKIFSISRVRGGEFSLRVFSVSGLSSEVVRLWCMHAFMLFIYKNKQ